MAQARTDPSPITHHPSLSGLGKGTLERLAKLGIHCKFDLVLHLPLRYDDETRLYPLNEAPPGQPVLVEGKVVKCNIQFRPRRQLACHIEDGSGVLTLRFFNFYQSQLKQLAAGTRVRRRARVDRGRPSRTRRLAMAVHTARGMGAALRPPTRPGGPRPRHRAGRWRAAA